MLALSLYQPWASLLAHGLKRCETRSWGCRGPFPLLLAVHATKKWGRELAAVCRREPFAAALRECGVPGAGWSAHPGLPLGEVVGLVRVVACVGTAEMASDPGPAAPLTPRELAFGDYTAGRYAWVCDRFLPLDPPVPARGRQQLWEWEPPPDFRARPAVAEWLAGYGGVRG